MNKPTKILDVKKEEYIAWLAKNSFAADGDYYEQKYHKSVLDTFPRNEEFWRCFVVPLTNRIEQGNKDHSIHFRDGVDDLLQYVSGASYSLFVHLAVAQEQSSNWTDFSLDGVYARLASSLDVFEELAIRLHLMMNEFEGVQSKLVQELTLEEFLKIAEENYKTEYPNIYKYYISNGKKPKPLNIPTGPNILKECFNEKLKSSGYNKLAQRIRPYRNAIIHDVRLGSLKDGGGKIWIPKAEAVSQYRRWSQIDAVKDDHVKVQKEFCEVQKQCADEVRSAKETFNELYGDLLNRFNTLFYLEGASEFREYFGVHFIQDGGLNLPVDLTDHQAHRSSSYETTYPGTSGTAPLSGTSSISGLNDLD